MILFIGTSKGGKSSPRYNQLRCFPLPLLLGTVQAQPSPRLAQNSPREFCPADGSLPTLFFPVSFFHLICYINVMKLTSIKKIFITIALPALFASCSSTPKEIPEDLTAQELIQKGQTEFENGRYKASLRYYNAVTERFAGEPAVYVEATYEIGHLFMKQKKYDKAEAVFQDLIDLYAAAQPGTLPGSYRKLSELEMEKIKAKKQ